MKRILIEGMTDNLGGIESFVYLLYSALKDNYQVDFITINEKIPFEDEFIANGSTIHRVTPRYKSVKQYCSDIDKVFQNGNYDVFWFNKTTISSIYTVKSAKKHGVKKVIAHSHSSKNMGNSLTLVMHTFNKFRIQKYVDVKAACSLVAAKWFFGNKTDDVVIFSNAVDVDKYEPNKEKQMEIKEKLGLKDKFVIGHVGRFSVEKNQTFLINVFDELVKICDAELILCGIGPMMDEIKALVKEKGLDSKVHFLGSRKDMPDIYQAMDVFVMPSLFEGLPFTLVEAQASGIPCVVSDTVSRESQLTDIIEFVSLNEDFSVWADKIAKYSDYEKISKKEQLTEKGFTIESFSKQVEKILES